jgi:hypothetical protein
MIYRLKEIVCAVNRVEFPVLSGSCLLININANIVA